MVKEVAVKKGVLNQISLGNDTTICEIDNYTLSVNGLTSGISYIWSKEENFNKIIGTGKLVSTVLNQGINSFFVKATDAIGCVLTDSIHIRLASIMATMPSSLILCKQPDTAIVNVKNMDPLQILSYDWSTDQSNWTNTGLTTSASVTGLSSGTQYTVYIRASNHFFTGTSYGSTTFTTTAAVIPTVTDVTASSITSSGATISWTSTNQSSYSLSGVGPSALTGTTVTSRAVGGLSSSTSYTAQVTVTSSTGNTASSSVNFTTLSAFVTPTVGVPSSFSFGRFNTGGSRQGVNWCWNHGSASGSVDTAYGGGSGITGYDWEIYTAPSGGAAINSGYKPYNSPPASLFLVSSPSGTTGAGSNSNSGPFNHKMGSSSDTPHTTSARYGRVRTVVRGSNGTDYYSDWTARI
jgi:hypothetical protein